MNSTQRRLLVAGLAIVVLIGGGIVAWLLFSGNAPEEATIGQAADVVRSESQGTAPPTTAPSTDAPTTTPPGTEAPGTEAPATVAPAGSAGIDGTWTVDTAIGEFSFQDATSSFVGFRVAEELSTVGAVEAVGRTPDVSGTIEIEGTTMTSGSFTAQLATLTTDRSRRDAAVRRALDTATFPEAMFAISGPVDFGAIPETGATVSVTAAGDLTIKGITQPVEFTLDAQLVDNVIVVVGRIPVVFADFDVTVPSAPVVLSADDNGVIEVQLFFTR